MRDGGVRCSSQTKGGLPPSPRMPAWLQTVALRRWPVSYLELCRSRLGPCFTVFVLDMPPLVFLSDPLDIEAVLAAPPSALQPGIGTALIAPLIGERSFMLCDDETRKAVRAAVSPVFRRGAKRHSGEVVETIARDAITSWPTNQPVALYPRLSILALRVILRLLLGDDHESEYLGTRLLNMLSVARSFVIQEPRLRNVPGWRSSWRRFQHQRGEVDQTLSRMIRRPDADGLECPSAVTMLRNIRNQGAPLTEQEISDDLLSLIVAGHETTASALAWACLFLAHNRSAQRRLIEEIDHGESTELMNATMLETLRLGPVFLFAIPRAVATPIDIGTTTYYPPAQLLACTYLMHHDPALYPEPYRFLPERFMEGMPPNPIWKPWGGGQRRCLGQHIAEIEMQTILREVLRAYELVPVGTHLESPGWRSAILAPCSGASVLLQPRVPRITCRRHAQAHCSQHWSRRL
jgi:cytochrome P450